jgi:Ca2+/H+ antiporter, TMEM165/GDT1 family
MAAFIASFMLVVLAEMGDKTQLLAMAFATRYSAKKVLIAVFLATVINHGLAVLVGHFLSVALPMKMISFAASLSFIGFGIWTLRGDKLHGEEKKESKFGPVLTVGIAFFLAEMGDKTQLATVALAVEYKNMFGVLIGTTLGMVVADAIGIITGTIVRKRVPDKIIKWVSASIFIFFGIAGMINILK